MATTPFTLTPGVWQRITDKGQGGTAWIKSQSQFSIVIDHVIVSGTPEDSFDENSETESSVGISVLKSFAMPSISTVNIPADTSEDVYYALLKSTDPDKTAIVVVDVS